MTATEAIPPRIPNRRVPWVVWFLGGTVILGLAVLHFFNPTQHGFYPACQFHLLTQLHCPGCGSLRALHLLSHGKLTAAFGSNPLLISSLPFLGWLGFRCWRAPREASLAVRPAFVWLFVGLVALFGILRNLSWKAFAWMAP